MYYIVTDNLYLPTHENSSIKSKQYQTMIQMYGNNHTNHTKARPIIPICIYVKLNKILRYFKPKLYVQLYTKIYIRA